MEAKDRTTGWIGTVLQNRWRIEAKIARGGVATVYRARSKSGEIAAVKIMHAQYGRNPDVRSRFLREGYAANKVGHPNVVRILEDGTSDDGSPFLVMELLEDGELLEERRERLGGRLPLDEVARTIDQLLDVLGVAHDQGIIHRDVKPENLFVLANGVLKVLDFGIAHIKEAALKCEPTATGLLLGTPEFMSPEQALGKRGLVDAQSDVWSAGATMFTLLTGEAVHVEDSLPLLLAAVATRPARSLSSAAFKGIPRDVVALVDRALYLEKGRRWGSARAMQAALRKAFPQAAGVAMLVPSPVPRALSTSAEVPALAPAERGPLLTTGDRPAVARPPPPSGRAWSPPNFATTTPSAGVSPPAFARPSAANRPPPALPSARSRSGPPPRPAPEAPPTRRMEGARPHPARRELVDASPETMASAPTTDRGAEGRTVIRPHGVSDADATPTSSRIGEGLDPWTRDFTDGDMEGPTVAVDGSAPPSTTSDPPRSFAPSAREAQVRSFPPTPSEPPRTIVDPPRTAPESPRLYEATFSSATNLAEQETALAIPPELRPTGLSRPSLHGETLRMNRRTQPPPPAGWAPPAPAARKAEEPWPPPPPRTTTPASSPPSSKAALAAIAVVVVLCLWLGACLLLRTPR